MTAIAAYLQALEAAYAMGNALEHTHRPALKILLESLKTGIVATNEPKRIDCGSPDLLLTEGQTPLGYVETKDIGKGLDEVENNEQLKRYRNALPNLILTDYLEFRWYVGGEWRLTKRLGSVVGKNKIKANKSGFTEVEDLLKAFIQSEAPTVSNPRELAQRMAHLAKLICEIIAKAIADEDEKGELHQQMEGFRKTLLHDLTQAQFADMYAQTIAYGLFAARCNVHDGAKFTRETPPTTSPKPTPSCGKCSLTSRGLTLMTALHGQ